MSTRRTVAAAVTVAALALTMTACGDDGEVTDAAGQPVGDRVTNLVVGAVPTLELGLIRVAEDKGYFAEQGVSVEVKNVESGPNVVTGVVADQYDLGYTAYAPPLLALGQGAPLKAVTSTALTGADGTNGSVLIAKDSGIDSWDDLAGKKIGSNAPRSLFSLVIPEAIERAGGDPSSIEIVPIPFGQSAKAVADGQVDAAATLEPFTTAGLEEFDELEDLGDPITAALPEGGPSGLFFTSAKTSESKDAAIDGFDAAIRKVLDDAKSDQDLVKKAGAPLAGLDEAQALALPDTAYSADVSVASLQPLVDLLVAHAWLTEAPDIDGFLSRG